MRTTIAVFNKKGDSALPPVIDVLKSDWVDQPLEFTVTSPKKVVSHKSPNVLSKQDLNEPALFGCAYTREAKKAYSFLPMDDASVTFEGKIYLPVTKEALAEQATKNNEHCEAQLQILLEKAEGDFSFFMLKDGWIGAARDPIGVQPLYYGENSELAAFASNRKSLWQLGIEKPLSFPPGNLGFVNKEGFRFKPVKTFTYAEPKQITMEQAAAELQKLLEQAVKVRVAGLKKVAVAFSGGLDSSLVAYLASKCGVKVDLIHVSLENEPETEAAIEASEKLGLPMQIHLFKESDVETALPQVVDLIEEADPVKAAIGIPFYWTAQKTRESGYDVLLAGQGADELFGGYQRYVNECCNDGNEKARKTMFGDVVRIHESNLERDEKICISLDVDLRLPFGGFDLVAFALGLPVDVKFEQKQDTLRKLVLRKVASNLGLPASIVEKPKKAVQYSTGINEAVKKIAKQHEQTVNEYITGLYERSRQRYSP
ncbi:MAG: asparagine synthase-related protein [Candidatus Bathyarchaeia archaeon]|jgi:asparagine synthase (glutamine-hydrolysing)